MSFPKSTPMPWLEVDHVMYPQPYCTQILGDLGSVVYYSLFHKYLADMLFSAEVLKIEHPTRGDDTRQWGPPYAPHLDGRPGPGESAYYLSVSILHHCSISTCSYLLGEPEQKVHRRLFQGTKRGRSDQKAGVERRRLCRELPPWNIETIWPGLQNTKRS